MRKLLLGAFLLALINWSAFAAVKTPAQIESEINSEITQNGVGAITGPVLNGILYDITQSYLTANAPQTWYQLQTFFLNPILPNCTGYLSGNGAAPSTCAPLPTSSPIAPGHVLGNGTSATAPPTDTPFFTVMNQAALTLPLPIISSPNGGGTFATRNIAEIINPGTAHYDQGLIINTEYIDSNNAAIIVTSPNQNGRALSIDGPNEHTPSSIVASISGVNLTLASGTLTQGQYLSDAGSIVLPGTYVVSGSGSSWIVSRSQTVAQETMSATPYYHYTHIDTNGSIWSLAFLVMSGNLSSNGTILQPSTDASMLAIWPDVPLAIQARSNGYGNFLSLLSADSHYTSKMDYNGTVWWGPVTNASINTMDAAIGRGNGPGIVNIGGPDTGAPVAETLTVSSAAAPIVVPPTTEAAYFYGNVLQFTSATFPSSWVVGNTINDITVPSGLTGGATITSINAGAYNVTLNTYYNPYAGDVLTNGTTTAALYSLPTPYLCYGSIPAGISLGQVVTDQTNPSGIVATTTVAALYPSIPAQGNVCIQLSQNANTNVANAGGSLDTFVYSTPNTAAANLNIVGGAGTGNASGGDIVIKTVPAGSSGSAQNTPVEAFRFTAAGGLPKWPSSITGAGTQTFTNSPCTGLTAERWIPVQITGQTGTWYVPACQ